MRTYRARYIHMDNDDPDNCISVQHRVYFAYDLDEGQIERYSKEYAKENNLFFHEVRNKPFPDMEVVDTETCID